MRTSTQPQSCWSHWASIGFVIEISAIFDCTAGEISVITSEVGLVVGLDLVGEPDIGEVAKDELCFEVESDVLVDVEVGTTVGPGLKLEPYLPVEEADVGGLLEVEVGLVLVLRVVEADVSLVPVSMVAEIDLGLVLVPRAVEVDRCLMLVPRVVVAFVVIVGKPEAVDLFVPAQGLVGLLVATVGVLKWPLVCEPDVGKLECELTPEAGVRMVVLLEEITLLAFALTVEKPEAVGLVV
ncbi:MAG: hypothetical protein LQ340_007114 [Diploschistes diacapsis]|nr:MAG: hypothetical protein LQ340_007114 [Diploschistes diacapsis]